MIVEKRTQKIMRLMIIALKQKNFYEIEYGSKLFLNIFVIFKNNLYKIITNLLHKANFFAIKNLHYLKINIYKFVSICKINLSINKVT